MAPRKQQHILDTTLALLAERGYDRLTIESVAERSGVNKTTLYRWWPSKPALLADALIQARALDFGVPDTGSLEGDLLGLAEAIAALLTTPPTAGIAVAALAASAQHPELATSVRAFFADRIARERPVFDRAVARGELRPDADPMTIVDLVAGAVWLRAVFRGQPVDEAFLRDVVRLALHGSAL
ncbi:MAG: TetR/AcrR family transcriptional regulator [Hamadaea sp.]|nr:TetR/AcrR family transcriptional regulator [Hamadaea sp.]NUR46647.1 TetR/AcrR family transcriptional regulator [Hamadaea sp.]NUT07248.1 TetR/AcrR family transcriptional regulator [Hamadaea sp.]